MYLLLITGVAEGSIFYSFFFFPHCFKDHELHVNPQLLWSNMARGAGKALVSFLVWTIWLLTKYLSVFLQLMPMDSIQTHLLAPSLTLFLHGVIQGDCCALVHSCPCSEASRCACPCLQQCSPKEHQPASTIKQCSAEINMSTGWDWSWKYLRVLHTPALGTKGTGPNQNTPLESIRTLKVTQGWWKHPHRMLCGQVQISTEGCVHGSCLPKALEALWKLNFTMPVQLPRLGRTVK